MATYYGSWVTHTVSGSTRKWRTKFVVTPNVYNTYYTFTYAVYMDLDGGSGTTMSITEKKATGSISGSTSASSAALPSSGSKSVKGDTPWLLLSGTTGAFNRGTVAYNITLTGKIVVASGSSGSSWGGTSTASGFTYSVSALPVYTITCAANGATSGANQSVNCYYTRSVTLPSTASLSKTGYTCQGWSTSSTATTATYASGGSYTLNTLGNVTLYAAWKPNTYTLTANSNEGTIDTTSGWSGTGTTATKSVTYNTAYSTLPSVSRSQYTLKGWYTSTSGGTQITSSSIYNTAQNQTIYAQWLETHTISYDLNGGSGTVPATQTKVANTDITLASTANITKTGYTCIGWARSSSATTADYISEATYTENSTTNITLYAIWQANTYVLKVNPQGGTYNGSTAIVAKTMTYNSTTNNTLGTTSSSGPTRSGYTFGGWYVGIGGTNTQVFNSSNSYNSSATAYWSSGKWIYDGDLTIYAYWIPIVYNITYTLNNGTLPTVYPTSYTIETPTFSLKNPTRTNFGFLGWTGTNISTAQTTVTIPQGTIGNKSYTANWVGNKVAPTFTAALNVIRYDVAHSKVDAEAGTSCKFYFSANPGAQYNPSNGNLDNKSTTISVQYKSHSASTDYIPINASNISGPSLTFTTNNYNYEGIITLSGTSFALDTNYDLKVTLTDDNSGLSITKTAILSVAYFPLDFRGDGKSAGIFRIAPDDKDGLFIKGNTEVSGTLTVGERDPSLINVEDYGIVIGNKSGTTSNNSNALTIDWNGVITRRDGAIYTVTQLVRW